MLSTLIVSTLLFGQASPGAKVITKDDLLGKGSVVKDGDIVAVDFVGKLADGSTFDSSADKDPILFIVGAGQVMKGWDLGILGMHEGGKRELTIPPSFGYGPKQVQSIPPNSTLYFTISLIKIEPKVTITVLKKGKGPEAKLGDKAYVYFSGGVQGQKALFDTRDNGANPVAILIGESTLPIGYVPSLLGMQPGEKRKVVIPSDLAYGNVGVPKHDIVTAKGTVKAGTLIPPGSTMEFTFELVKLEAADSK